MSFDLYTDELGKKVDALPLTTTIAPGIWDNFFPGTGQVAMQGFAKTARAASRLGAIPAIIGDKVMGSTVLQDSYFATTDPIFQGAVDFWTPKPNEVGVAAEVVGSLISQLPLMLAAPSLAVASAQMSGAEDVITAPGVTTGQALGVGLAQGIGLGVGIWAPPALGYNLASKAATGAAVNWLQGVLTRGASSAILGDNPVAKNYQPFGAKDQAIDVLLGLAFGAASQYVPSWKAEAEARTDQVNVPAQRAIANEIGQTTPADMAAAANLVNARSNAARAETLKEWADSATPTQKAGLAVARLSHHMQIDSAPGRATSPGAANDHVMRLREAIDSLVRDGTVPLAPDVPRETLDQFTRRAAVDIAGNSKLTSTVQILQRAYIEQGPEAGRVMLDEMVAQLPEPDRPPGFADEVHQQLTERTQEWQEKQQPAFVPDPEREAFAVEQIRAMQEAAARIAREEGLPEGPSILLPIADQLKAHLTETGFRQADNTLRKMTPEEASQYIKDHAALDEVNLRAMAAMTGGKMSPEQLLNRYLADVKMRAPAPAGALEQRMTPAQHIADYKPTVETSQYGGTRYRNQYLELGNSTATNSKGQKGERRSFEIMDKSGGTAATVGFVIVEIDSKGKFAALRNIEIRSDIRTKGLGENVVATLVAHNGRGYQMDIVDITHGGHVGTDGDALPFWQKMGTRLKNYSRDSAVQMDGMLSLEDYLGARSGQGLAAGRGRGQAQAVPADGAGAGAARGSLPRSGPTAADRAELARLNSLFQGPAGTKTNTPQFRQWFGDSKILDTNGQPLVVYHRTGPQADFESFVPQKPKTVYRAGDQELVEAMSWDMGNDGQGAPDAYHYMAIGDAAFMGAEKALEIRRADAKTSTHPDTLRLLRDLERLQGKDVVRSTEVRPSGDGSYFTPDPGYSFIRQPGAGAVYPVYLRIENPIYLNSSQIEGAGLDFNVEKYRALGHDGAIFRSDPTDLTRAKWGEFTQIVIFDGNQAKSAISNKGDFSRDTNNILFQGTPWYHSALSRAIDNVPTKAQPAQGWKDWLKGQIQKGAIKADEVKYTGLEEYLDLQQGKITKEQLQTFMQEGGVRVEEVTLGEPMVADGDVSLLAKNGLTLTRDETGSQWALDNGKDLLTDKASLRADYPKEVVAAAGRVLAAAEGAPPTRFSNWQLPGAKEGSYRELALVLPEGRTLAGRRAIFAEYQPRLDALYRKETLAVGPVAQQLRDQISDLQDERDRRADQEAGKVEDSNVYRVPSAHSMGDKADINRLAHIRFNERTGPNGERVLFIEEIQSDWAQQGKKQGFAATAAERAEADALMAKADAAGGITNLSEADQARGRELGAKIAGSQTPAGPFVTKTEAWVALSLKRMIRYAAENGFDQIAWTTGEQQAARYDLSKHIDRIDYSKDDDGTYSMSAIKDGRELFQKEGLTIKEVEDQVGKEVAEKIANDEGKAGGTEDDDPAYKSLSGLDLKVGGEGMKGFYDKIVPSVAKDVLKKLGGGKVEQTAIEIPGTAKELPSLKDIDEETWDALAGAEQWEGGQRPQVGETRLMVDGQIRPMTMVLDRNGVQFVSHDGDLVVMFDAGDVMDSPNRALWEKSPEQARELLAEAWQKPARWEQLQVIIGDAKEAKPAEPEASKQQAITITPEMRTKAMESQALFQRAGHMSPHTFSRFDHSHMSKGEGAQVYGWGTYLFTKKEVGDWYYNNFVRKAEQEAKIFLVDEDRAMEIAEASGPKMVDIVQAYLDMRQVGRDAQAAWISVADDFDLGDPQYRQPALDVLDKIEHEAVRTLTSRDDPAYKTPDGQVVHVSQIGPKRNLASAIGQVDHEGYARAALTFDNLITHAQAHLDGVKRTNDLLRTEIHEQLAADFEAIEVPGAVWGKVDPEARRYQIIQLGAPKRKMAVVEKFPYKPGYSVRDPDTGYSLSGGDGLPKEVAERLAVDWNTDPERTGRYDAGTEVATSPKEAIERHRASLQRAIEKHDALDASAQDRVDETKRQRALVDEITGPAPARIKIETDWRGGERKVWLRQNSDEPKAYTQYNGADKNWDYFEQGFGNRQFDTKAEADAFGDERQLARDRMLKPGYEIVKPTPKPVRKYTVEAPENDVLLNWEVSAGEQPVKVREALEQQGVIIADEGELLATAEQAREMDEFGIRTDSALTEDERNAILRGLAPANSDHYRERALEFLQDQLGVDARLVLDPQISGRDIYIEIMKMVGYTSGRLDGENTQYAADASKMLASAGIPGHRFYDGNSRSGRRKDQTYNFVIYDESAIDIVHMEQDQTRGYLNIGEDRKMTMGFLQSSDPSTPIHERAHFFLEMLDDLSKEFPAAEAEMQVLFKEWGVDRQTWDTWSLDDKRFYHEQFARSWEAYLMSNKAPTPELRSVFRRFRDWLLAIYESAQTLNVKVSAEMRELFDRMHGSQQLDPSTDPAAKAAASGPPPPPQPGVESQRPPGTVDPVADMPTETQPFVPRTMDDQDMREHLRYMVDNELGWAQIGGKNLGGVNGVPNFSTWIPRAEWWALRPDNVKKLKEHEYEAAVAKALVGDKLKPIEQRAVDFMMHVANERMKAEQAIGRDEWNNIAKEVVASDLEPTTKNVVDADAVAIANQIDEGMVERLAIQYDADDAGFMAEIRRMIDDHQNPETAAGSQEAIGQAPEGVPAARPAAQPGPEASAKAAGSDGVDLLAQEADRFVADNPDLTLEFEMPDGSTQKMTAAEYLADVRESAAMAREDVKLIHEAAQCLLGTS